MNRELFKNPQEDDVVVETDRADRFLWECFQDDCGDQLDDVAEDLERADRATLPGVAEFAREVFARAFARSDKLADGTPPAPMAWQGKAHEALGTLPEWRAARALVSGNDLASGAFTADFARAFLSNMPKPPDPPESDDEQAQQEYEQACQEHADNMDEAALHMALYSAIEAGGQAAEQAIALGRLPGTEAGSGGKVDKKQVLKLMKAAKEQPKLKQIAEAAGRLRAICTRVRKRRTKFGQTETYGVELGDDLSRLLPSEMVALKLGGIPRQDVMTRISEHRSLQYARRGHQKETRGPMVLLVDGSGSMSGEREAWAKGFALALLDIAREQKRPWLFCQFDGRVHSESAIEYDGKSGPDFDRMIESMLYFPAGGTNFDYALTYGLDNIDRIASLKKADVLLITDGECGISHAVQERVKAAHASVISILIDPWPGSQFRDLKAVSAKTITVKPDADNDAHGLFIEIGGE